MGDARNHSDRSPSRRTFLAACAALSGGLAGCLGDETDDPGDDGAGDDGSGGGADDGGGDGDGDGDGDDPGAVSDHDSIQYGPPDPDAPRPEGASIDSGGAVLIDGASRARAVLGGEDGLDDRREAVRTFVDETDFAAQRLCYVESTGPNACYEALEFSDVAVADGRLTAAAALVDTSGPEEACAQVETTVGALLRVAFDGDPADEAAVTITDGWGESGEVVVRADDPIDPREREVPGHVRPDGDPSTVRASLSCDGSSGRYHAAGYDGEVPWGRPADGGDDSSAFRLRVDALEASYGDTVTVELTNVSEEEQYTGNRHKYNLETYTEDGWEDVRFGDEDSTLVYTDEAIEHEPGEGLTWELELTEDGLVADHVHEDELTVCPDLEPGRYRFVFWEPTVAVAWDLVAE